MKFLYLLIWIAMALTLLNQAAKAGTDSLPDITTSTTVITRDLFNTERNSLQGDFVCRNLSGDATANFCNNGTSSFPWLNGFYNELTLGDTTATATISVANSADIVLDTGAASKNITGKINGTNAFECSSTTCSFYSGGSVVADFDANGVNTDDIANSAITTAKIGANAVTRAKMESVGLQISSSSGTFNTTSTSPVDVTNLSLSITTSGREVAVGLTGNGIGGGCELRSDDDSGDGLHSAHIYILRDALFIFNSRFGNISGAAAANNIMITPAAYSVTDNPGSGTYTYKVQLEADNTSDQAHLTNCRLYAREL